MDVIYKFFKNYFLYENKTLPFSDSPGIISFLLGRMHYVKREYGDEITVPDKKYSTFTLTRFSESLREFIWFDEKIESDCRTLKVSVSSELATVERKDDDGNIVMDLVYFIDFEPLFDDVS